MRTHIDIDLNTKTITKRQIEGEALAHAGRYLIARSLLEAGRRRC
jgi:aldehyde:ferredoxin oxidoreductase